MATTYPFSVPRLIDLCRQNDVSQLGVFGSVARGEGTAQSDLDLLVSFQSRKSLLEVVALERQLSQAFGQKVDLLTEAAISPYLRPAILSDLKVIYEAR